jgi:hypothetical protein
MSTSPQKNENAPILTQPAAELPVIEELSHFMQQKQFATLKEMLVYSAPELLQMEGFGYRCLKSLYQVLEENGCEHLLREE